MSALGEHTDGGAEQEATVPDGSEGPAGPRIEVLGDASAEQVAALVAVLSGLGDEDEEPAGPPSRWASRERLVRSAVHPSRGGWRASALPR
ncbi:acyl-CoA carboxylase subunit epsilon [Janibacter sp. GS2]|uniref:acyl-CoA carboxylase subunit epsilon n=1 Tax=Janibacter sp. GS2 TaxID=3442646 RepID=UPI003EBF44BB